MDIQQTATYTGRETDRQTAENWRVKEIDGGRNWIDQITFTLKQSKQTLYLWIL